jgi:hypothetical protein
MPDTTITGCIATLREIIGRQTDVESQRELRDVCNRLERVSALAAVPSFLACAAALEAQAAGLSRALTMLAAHARPPRLVVGALDPARRAELIAAWEKAPRQPILVMPAESPAPSPLTTVAPMGHRPALVGAQET